MLIFSIRTKPNNFYPNASEFYKEMSEVYLRTSNFSFGNENYTCLCIVYKSDSDDEIQAILRNYSHNCYFVVEDETVISQYENTSNLKIGKYVQINLGDNPAAKIIKPFKYSGNKNLVFKRGHWGNCEFDKTKKLYSIDVEIDKSQLGELPVDEKIERLIIDENDAQKLVDCGFLVKNGGDLELTEDRNGEFVITILDLKSVHFARGFDSINFSLKLRSGSFKKALKKSDFEAQKNKEKEKKTPEVPKDNNNLEQVRNQAIQNIKDRLAKNPEIKSSELDNPNWETWIKQETDINIINILKNQILTDINDKRSTKIDAIRKEKKQKEAEELRKKAKGKNKAISKKEAILNNLSEWCVDPLGNIVFAKPFMNQKYYDQTDYYYDGSPNIKSRFNNPPPAKAQTNIIWDENSELTPEDQQEIRQAFLKEIKTNPQDWTLEKEGKLEVIIHKSGRKHWHWGTNLKIDQAEWEKVNKTLKNVSSSNSNSIISHLSTYKWRYIFGGGIIMVGFFVYRLIKKYFFSKME